jgi:phosphohistidine phosphatase
LNSLYLLRHAKSSWDEPGLVDHDRPLAPKGQKAARRMAVHVRKAKIRPQLVLCSTATRAVQTYEALSGALEQPVVVSVEAGLYGATDADLLARLHDVPDTVSAVLLVGHNPGLQDLALGLAYVGNPADLARLGDKFPTCALASLEVPTPWAALGPGHAYLKSLVLPRDLSA